MEFVAEELQVSVPLWRQRSIGGLRASIERVWLRSALVLDLYWVRRCSSLVLSLPPMQREAQEATPMGRTDRNAERQTPGR